MKRIPFIRFDGQALFLKCVDHFLSDLGNLVPGELSNLCRIMGPV